VFQRMIAEATLEPSLFDAIIVHSRSRFFRDLFECLRYERLLKRAAVRVLSITQQTSDDASGELNSKIISMFDEYQSKENGKHTLRAMQENARQGFFNGSRPPFRYRTVAMAASAGSTAKRFFLWPLLPIASVSRRRRDVCTRDGAQAQPRAGAGAAAHRRLTHPADRCSEVRDV